MGGGGWYYVPKVRADQQIPDYLFEVMADIFFHTGEGVDKNCSKVCAACNKRFKVCYFSPTLVTAEPLKKFFFVVFL